MEIKGYKVFNSDWTCRDFQYEVGKTYELDGEPRICDNGFHFCVNVANCFNYYSFDPSNKVAEVLAVGETVTKGDKSATNKIVIVKELNWHEMLVIANTGKGNSGLSNSGDWNSGDRNSGDSNSGYSNSGYRNSGDSNSGYRNSGDRNSGYSNSGYSNSGYRNSGDWNSGDWNSGDRNSGDWNSGDWNSGDRNSGDFNLSDNNSGCFNTEDKTIMFFDKESDMNFTQWRMSRAYGILCRINFTPTTWVSKSNMTEEEKKANADYQTLGGYLKKNDLTQVNKEWWSELTHEEKEVIKAIPNFDADKFKKIMGIDVNEA